MLRNNNLRRKADNLSAVKNNVDKKTNITENKITLKKIN